MERSLSAAVSGINASQTYLDTIGNNIANSSTDGFKQQSVLFSDLLNQQVAGATAPVPPARGGVNPTSVGSGVQVAATVSNFAEGALVQTGVSSNAAIQGQGFFVVNAGGTTVYTRAGDFSLDASGNLVTPSGGLVQGWPAVNGVVNPNGPTTAVKIPKGVQAPPVATSQVVLGGNLSSSATTPQDITATAYDSQGNTVPITLTFTPNGAGSWSLTGTVPNPGGGAATNLWNTAQKVTFGANGQIATINGTAVTAQTAIAVNNLPAGYQWATGATLSIVMPAPGSSTALTQVAGASSAGATSQNGFSAGQLTSYSIGSTGTITGSFTNGSTEVLGQISLASFANDQGLSNLGNNYYAVSANSGTAQVGVPGTGARGSLVGGTVEGSNVSLARELTDLVTAQTNYQANTKVISTTAAVLQALVNMP